MKFSINPFKTSMTMSKIETASKLSLKLTSSIKLGRRGARAELSTLDTDHKPPPPSPPPPQREKGQRFPQPMRPNLEKTADLATLTEENLNRKLDPCAAQFLRKL